MQNISIGRLFLLPVPASNCLEIPHAKQLVMIMLPGAPIILVNTRDCDRWGYKNILHWALQLLTLALSGLFKHQEFYKVSTGNHSQHISN